MGFHSVRSVKVIAAAAMFMSFLWLGLPARSYAQAGFNSWITEINNRPGSGHCATEAAFQITNERRKAGLFNIEVLTPNLKDSIASPSGRFKVFFNDTGAMATDPAYASYVAHIADTAFLLEIDTLGYAKPPYAFADSTWHIYLVPMNGGNYGFTAQSQDAPFGTSPSGLDKYRSFITMDNSFTAAVYPTHGLDAARITVFHEFHHVIQFGDFGYGQAAHDVNFREMTSVWLEMRSSPWIKDYQQYVSAYFDGLHRSFMLADAQGYGQCIWMKFLVSNFADSVVKQVWTWYSTIDHDYLIAFDTVLGSHGSSFCEQYHSFGTGLLSLRSVYTDSKSLPVNQNSLEYLRINLLSGDTSLMMDAASLQFFEHTPLINSGKAFVASRNTDLNQIATLNIHFDQNFSSTSDHPESYCAGPLDLPSIGVAVYPQPFVYSPGLGQTASILASSSTGKPISCILRIFTPDNSLVRHIDSQPSLSGGSWFISWDGLDDTGRAVPSGIYYYNLLTDGVRTQGKIAVIRK